MLALLFIAAAGPVPFSQAFAHGKELYNEAQFGEAIATFDEALSRPDVSAADKREVLLFIGFAQIGLGNDEAARRRFREVLKSRPDQALPAGTSPKIRSIFEKVRAEEKSSPSVEPAIPLVGPSPMGAGMRMRFRLVNATPSIRAWLYWRGGLLNNYTRLPIDVRGVDGSADLDQRLMGGGRVSVEYFVELREGELLRGGLADAEHPRRVDVGTQQLAAPVASAVRSEPLYKKWWLWTIVGAVVVGAAATGTYFAVKGAQPQQSTGGLDVNFQVAP